MDRLMDGVGDDASSVVLCHLCWMSEGVGCTVSCTRCSLTATGKPRTGCGGGERAAGAEAPARA